MIRLQRLTKGTAALMAMAISTSAVAPILLHSPASAQYVVGQSLRVTIPAKTIPFPVTYSKEKIVLTKEDAERTLPITATIATDIIDRDRKVLIRQGTKVNGRLQAARTRDGKDGVKFVATSLEFLDGRKASINASSDIVTRTEKIQKGADTGKILTNAAIGAAAATGIALVTGNKKAELGQIVLGGVAGAAYGYFFDKKSVNVYVLNGETDLDILLESPLTVSRF